MKLYNQREFKERRRALRRNQTQAEKQLWFHLRNRQLEGFKFLRQYSVGPYILDFYCVSKKLAVELDGGQHQMQREYDAQRTVYLGSFGIKVLRFWNNEVIFQKDSVLEKLRETLCSNPS